MLAEVIETRETTLAMALEGPLPGMFAWLLSAVPAQDSESDSPDVTGEMLAASEGEIAGREVSAEEALAAFLLCWPPFFVLILVI